MIVVKIAVKLCADESQYIEIGDSWEPGTSFPLLDGPALRRYRKLFHDGALPSVARAPRVGSVVSVGGEVSRVAAGLLATATSRSHVHVPGRDLLAELAKHPEQMFAVVGITDEFADVADWPGTVAAHVGLLIARSASALACLIYRCLTVAAVPAEDGFFVAANPLVPRAHDPSAVKLSELANPEANRKRVVVIHGPGRECSVSLLDSVLCGRAEPLGSPMYPETGLRATPCLMDEGCFRTDLEESEITRAEDVNAALVCLVSCSTIAVGAHVYPYGLSVALGLLEGTSVAVVGVRGVYYTQSSGEWDLQAGLAEGLPLGEIVHRMTRDSRPLNGELSQYGLLGDPGMVLPGNAINPAGKRSRRVRPEPWSAETLSRLVVLGREVVPRLERLRWLGLVVPDEELLRIRRRIRQLIVLPYDDESASSQVSAIEEKLARLQHGMIKRQLEVIFRTGWNFVGPGHEGFRETSKQAAICPSCDQLRATKVVLRHHIEAELYVQAMHCRRCGIPWWTTEPGQRTVVVDGPIEVRARLDEICYFEREIRNIGADVLRGAAGYTFRHHNRGLPAPGWTERCEVVPGEAQRFRPVLDLKSNRPQRDTHTAPFIALVNGIYTAAAAMIQIE